MVCDGRGKYVDREGMVQDIMLIKQVSCHPYFSYKTWHPHFPHRGICAPMLPACVAYSFSGVFFDDISPSH